MKEVVSKPASSFPAMLNAYKAEIARALPSHLNGDRMARIALTCFRQNPKLGDCAPKSVFAAVIMAAQLGLEPGIGGQAYLIPYGNECQFVPGWQGLVDLVSRAGRASVWTGAVFDGDEFDYALGDSPHVTHRPSGDEDESKLTHVYAIGRIDGAKWPVIEVWPIDKVKRHRDRYNKVGKRHYSFQHLEMYGRKVALMQVLKYMPKSVELQTAMALDHASESATQHLNVADAIEGTFVPVDTIEHAEAPAEVVEMPRAKAAAPATQDVMTRASAGKPLSAALQKILDTLCARAGVPPQALAERYPTIDTENFNMVRDELQAMIDADVAAAKE